MNALATPRRWERLVWPALAALLVLLAWNYSVIWSRTKVFPSPLAVERGLAELARKGLMWGCIRDSLCRVALGYLAAAVTGIPGGLILGWYPRFQQTVNPVIQMLRPISPIAWIPLAVLLFGVGDATAVFLIFLSAFFPVVVASAGGVAETPTIYRRAGRNFGLTSPQILLRVVFPSALPQIITGLRIALGISWVVMVAAEMIAVDSGLGYLVIDSRNSGKRYDLVVAAMLLIGLIGLALDLGFRRLRDIPSIRWGFRDAS